ncbi:MAG: MFS transporter [Vicinamibacterales bacterium]
MRLPSALRALHSRNYRLFVAGQVISLVGTWMQSVAQSWLIYRLTGSAALLGLIGFAAQIPIFILAPVGGVIADRLNRHRVLIATQSAMMVLAFALAALTLAGVVREWHIFVLSTLLGIANAFDIPTRQAFLAETVSRDDIVNAIALNSSMLNGARIVGPAIAGIIVAAFGEGWCFLLNAISYVAVIWALLVMRVDDEPHPEAHVSAWASVMEGFAYSWTTKPVRALLLLLGLVSVMGMPYSVLMPVIAASVLGGGPNAYGLLMSASGVGALAGAALLTLRRHIRGLGRWVAISAASFGISLIAFSFSRVLWLSALLLVPAGFFMMVEMAASNTLIQSMIPNRLRGRVMSVYSMMFMGMAPVGALVAGALAAPLGAPATVALGGAICIAGGLLFGAGLPHLREPARELIVAQQLAAGSPAEEVTPLQK